MNTVWLIVSWLISQIHVSHGPYGIVTYIQPPHIAAGLSIVRSHVVTWFQVA